MKKQLEQMIQIALRELLDQQELVAMPAFIQIEASKEKKFGDFATNIALILARTSHHAPYTIAERIVARIPKSPLIDKIEICHPGFINFFLAPTAFQGLLTNILSEKSAYGCCKIGRAKKVLVEFVSAAPIKPLTQQHARLAIFGKTIAKLLDTVGFNVAVEYFIDNIGLAVDIFVVEVWGAYLLQLASLPIPTQHTLFTKEVANLLEQAVGKQFYQPNIDIAKLGANEHDSQTTVAYAQSVLDVRYDALKRIVTDIVVKRHQEELASLGVTFDYWISAQSLLDVNNLDKMLNRLAAKDVLFQAEGGYWFRSTQFGDERDRVLVRPSGDYTHLAYDLAYHLNKFERGFDLAIDIFDFNPVDYASGIQAGMQALGYDPEQLMPFYVQPAHVIRDGKHVNLSLNELQTIYPKDELYFQLLTKRACQPIELAFDAHSLNDHPLSYVQYAAVRIQTVFNELHARGMAFVEADGFVNVAHLVLDEERRLLNLLASYTETVVNAALQYEPHVIVHYLRTLAAEFHAYYNACPFLVDDYVQRSARLTLIKAVQQVLSNGCALLSISLPETM